jgi:hypothetical protein
MLDAAQIHATKKIKKRPRRYVGLGSRNAIVKEVDAVAGG